MTKREPTPEEAMEMMSQMPRFIGVNFWEGVAFCPDIILNRILLGIGIVSAPPLSPFYGLRELPTILYNGWMGFITYGVSFFS